MLWIFILQSEREIGTFIIIIVSFPKVIVNNFDKFVIRTYLNNIHNKMEKIADSSL